MEQISKITLAASQLTGAVWLFFQCKNFIATYSLTKSAHEVICDLLKHERKRCVWDSFDELCVPGAKNLLRQKERQNWAKMKHADRDPKGLEHFDHELTPLTLLGAIIDLHRLASEIPLECSYFQTWMIAAYPGVFKDDLFFLFPSGTRLFAEDFSKKSLNARIE